ncbi:MAG: MBOAT family O-acyltransferase [Kiritimatiellales bacterium]
MVFSSIIFLFFFLPLTLAVYHLLFLPVSAGHRSATVWRHLANFFLLAVSLLFYFWGEAWLIWIMIVSMMIDYLSALLISGAFHKGRIEQLEEGGPRTRLQRAGIVLSLSANLALLGFFKYFNFGVDSLNAVLPEAWRLTDVMRVTLPLGISFYTFQSMSYTIDVYRGHVKATRNLIDFACYVTLFPQLVAGPIVRYCDVAYQMMHRTMSRAMFVSGISRFTTGLAKKVLIANTVAKACEGIFQLPPEQMTAPLAWIGMICYSLQIYYDFSGYSDMAIGLGRMFGFEFLENFNYPYVARSIQDFWRRWHISLSTWFRDYLYIPLGGSRKSNKRTYLNLIIVFFLCGLWHGANWAFVIWGLYHGFFLVIERMGLDKLLKRLPVALQHFYTLLVVMTGWLLFATESFAKSANLFRSLWGFAPSKAPLYVEGYFSRDIQLALLAGIILSLPTWPALKTFCHRHPAGIAGWSLLRPAGILILLLLCCMFLASGTHNPFIYFRF